MKQNLTIQRTTEHEFAKFWPEFSDIIKAQETYAFNSDMNKQQAYDLWGE